MQKGDLLARLDDRDAMARHDEASAALGRARAEAVYAEVDLERKRILASDGLISRNDLGLAERSAAISRQIVLAAAANLEYAAAQLEYTRIVAPIDGVIVSVSTA